MKTTYKKALLPLRDIVIFPSMVVPLFVGREKSIKALQEVMKSDKSIVLVTQKNSEVDDPVDKDLFGYGCLSKILQLLKLPDGTVKVLVEGEKRVKILKHNDFLKSKEMQSEFLKLYINFERKKLIERIEKRTLKMIKLGAIKEVKKFNTLKLSPQSSINKVIGIQELKKFLEKQIKIDEAKELIDIKTRQYAKRQATWARSKMVT